MQSYSSCADAYAALSDKQHGFAQVASAPDAPVANTSWQIETWRDSSTFGWQKATHTSDDKVYQRHLWTGNWSSWESVSDQIAIQTGTIGTHEYTSNTTDNVATLFKSNGIVYINIDIHGKNGATFPSTTDLFSIPTGFRPSENIRVPALMHHSTADVWVSYYATITSGGKIRQAWSSTCDAITISSFYLGN